MLLCLKQLLCVHVHLRGLVFVRAAQADAAAAAAAAATSASVLPGTQEEPGKAGNATASASGGGEDDDDDNNDMYVSATPSVARFALQCRRGGGERLQTILRSP